MLIVKFTMRFVKYIDDFESLFCVFFLLILHCQSCGCMFYGLLGLVWFRRLEARAVLWHLLCTGVRSISWDWPTLL